MGEGSGTSVAPALSLTAITKRYTEAPVLFPTSLEVQTGEFVTILGPSGCGKSTLLRIITGIIEPTGGTVRLDGTDVTHLPPERRDMAIVFQSYALFPHMSVGDNIRFGLKMKRIPRAEADRRFDHVVGICGLTPLLRRMPRHLSGGQQQRVALARALVMQPTLLLLDEPLSNLDAKLRDSLREDLLELHRETRSTSLYVTHDQTEAMSMSDRIILLNEGRVVETGTPRDLYLDPKMRFTAEFLGQTNIVPVTAEGRSAGTPWGQAIALRAPAHGPSQVSLRAEALRISPDTSGPATVTELQFLGADVLYSVDCGGHAFRVRRDSDAPLIDRGTRVDISAMGDATPLQDTPGEAA
ncbi:ABC transporter ATP-binding protein [Salipiger pallidus]|uniref:ABC transporter ATP-binding protein n=1 Tax=Salipiger pallidus TaxID=1775170 RepID=A0A8J2ZHV2_9RHOB|nr:ABC transporter ATP-binding protein [Salipiger pallidus]GGG66538.1 ABC transporter ATP-binding protein [Salipiger pallidus]